MLVSKQFQTYYFSLEEAIRELHIRLEKHEPSDFNNGLTSETNARLQRFLNQGDNFLFCTDIKDIRKGMKSITKKLKGCCTPNKKLHGKLNDVIEKMNGIRDYILHSNDSPLAILFDYDFFDPDHNRFYQNLLRLPSTNASVCNLITHPLKNFDDPLIRTLTEELAGFTEENPVSQAKLRSLIKPILLSKDGLPFSHPSRNFLNEVILAIPYLEFLPYD
ncbi:MAG: hypothetical protein ACI9S8_001812 [Chlamydiales bacterium]|jgi:hypothetical protein